MCFALIYPLGGGPPPGLRDDRPPRPPPHPHPHSAANTTSLAAGLILLVLALSRIC